MGPQFLSENMSGEDRIRQELGLPPTEKINCIKGQCSNSPGAKKLSDKQQAEVAAAASAAAERRSEVIGGTLGSCTQLSYELGECNIKPPTRYEYSRTMMQPQSDGTDNISTVYGNVTTSGPRARTIIGDREY